MNNITFTECTADDLLEVYSIYETILKEQPDTLSLTSEELSFAFVKKKFSDAQKRGIFIIAKKHDKVIGFCLGLKSMYEKYSHYIDDITIAIHPNHQNSLIGIKLINYSIKGIFQKYPNLQFLRTEIHSNNVKSFKVLQYFKFIPVCNIPNKVKLSNGEYSHAVLMILEKKNFIMS